GQGAEPRAADRAGRAGPGTGAGAGAPARLPDRRGLRTLPRGSPLRRVRRPAGGRGQRRPRPLPLVRPPPPGMGPPRLRPRAAPLGTAEAPARAFPGTRVVVSGGSATIGSVPPAPALVVATPGAEPLVDGGYAAAVLLDGWVLLGRPSLAAAQEALRRWMNAA